MTIHTIEVGGTTHEVKIEGSAEHLAFFGSIEGNPDIQTVGGEDIDEVLENIRDRLEQN